MHWTKPCVTFLIFISFFGFVHSYKMPLQRRLKKRQFRPHYRHHCLIDPESARLGVGVQHLCNLHDYAYVGPVTVGEPEQVLWMDFDTGSADSWIMTSDCRTQTCLAFPRFEPSLSLTFQNKNERLKFVYGLGDTMLGYRATDKICIGSLCVPNMDFAAATTVNQANVFMDGLIGLAYPKLSIFGSSFLGRVKPLLDKPMFAVWLNRDTDPQAEGGEITFGYTNPDRYVDVINYVPVVNQTFWTIGVDDVYLSDPTTGVIEKTNACPQPCRAIVDTATSFLIGPNNATAAIIDRWQRQRLIYLDKNSKWSLDCQTLKLMPNLVFTLGKRQYVLTPEDYTLAEDAFAPCDRKLAIDSHVQDVEFWVLGGAFLGKFYSVFDFENNRVGFAEAAKPAAVATKLPPLPDAFFRG